MTSQKASAWADYIGGNQRTRTIKSEPEILGSGVCITQSRSISQPLVKGTQALGTRLLHLRLRSLRSWRSLRSLRSWRDFASECFFNGRILLSWPPSREGSGEESS